MNRKSSIHIVCTVGTGTAGTDSFVAHGILFGIRHASPGHVWLCPSLAADSIELAEYVASEVLDSHPNADIHILRLTDHDDLGRCRRELRDILHRIAMEFPGHRIVLNPTSGTKQMTTAAVLAAVDEGIERIEYVTGARRNGVVKTGAEQVTSVDGRGMQARQTARNALVLIQSGAYRGAESLIEPYADLFPSHLALARVFGFWHRFAYRKALRAVPSGDAFATLRRPLNTLANAPLVSLERAADMAAFTDRTLDFGEPEEALAVLYRLAELLAKVRLLQLGIDPLTPRLPEIEEKLSPPKPLHDKLVAILRHNSDLQLGLALSLELLEPTHSPLYTRLFADRFTWELLQERQNTRYGHGVDFVDAARVRELRRRVLDAATAQWPAFPSLVGAYRFPEVTTLIEEESTHA